MLDQVLGVFAIIPDTDLNLMQPSQTLGALTARAIDALDGYLAVAKPNLVLIQGDTTTVLAAAITAFYHKIPVGHVEAGLRTWDLRSPWPEEANRVLATRLASLHFAPTENNRLNLLKEGIESKRIFVTGNTVIDALHVALDKIRECHPRIPGLPGNSLDAFDGRPVVLITGHRRENFGEGFEEICTAISVLGSRFPETHFIYPVHLNPNVQEPVKRILGNNATSSSGNIHLIEPLDYIPFITVLNRACLILTDSGGVQEEAPSLGKPVLVMRDNTERPEAVKSGFVKLVGASSKSIVRHAEEMLCNQHSWERGKLPYNLYGDGSAAARIIMHCQHFLASGKPNMTLA